MRTRLAILVLLTPVLAPNLSAQRLPTTEPENVGISSERLARIDRVFSEHVAEGQPPNLSTTDRASSTIHSYSGSGSVKASRNAV